MKQVTERILHFNTSRIPHLVKIKYGLMTENQFRFFRGTCHLFYEDLSKNSLPVQAPRTWICGDLHLENFGSFQSPFHQVRFDLNDFDEAILAPASWEIVRLVTSIFVAFESLGIEEKKAFKLAALLLKTYGCTLASGKSDFVELGTAQGIVRDFLVAAGDKKQKHLLERKTYLEKNKLKIKRIDDRHIDIDPEIKPDLFHHVNDWLRNDENSPYNYKVCDGVFRIAGTGSVGVKRYAFLLKTLNKAGEQYIMLDMKQSLPSSLIPYTQVQQPNWPSEAERIITIQRKMQNRNPSLLSTSYFDGEEYVMQEMQPTEDSINFKLLKKRYRDMYQVIDTLGMLTASAQLRSAGQLGSASVDELVEFGADSTWQQQVLEYAAEYSRQVNSDYDDFLHDFPLLGYSHKLQPITQTVKPLITPLKVAL